ncbi:PKD domain-containing protein [Alteromonas lipolytica]|uniref:Fibronectin type-III domain-containing protein n=1 Tax=Alteromonas lipolytica TaxID=1856405 RepID=A0A1E8FBK2_9ALTE|nr:hypothetical protein [Alteromonas lipolytica]OFI32988.1 hypothetical protein BFC17_01565 [Alteromonas lipolytica]GGF63554.1 hypothetical protein GCM10011338_14940 [Alteromonas lipolytica]
MLNQVKITNLNLVILTFSFLAVFAVSANTPDNSTQTFSNSSTHALGNFKVLNVFCDFTTAQNASETISPTEFESYLLLDEFPSLFDFWQTNAYGKITFAGSEVVPNWVTVDADSSLFINHSTGMITDHQGLFESCLTALTESGETAQPDNFDIINLIVNEGFRSQGRKVLGLFTPDTYGGNTILSYPDLFDQFEDVNGEARFALNVVAHEFGHALGLHHSRDHVSEDYGSLWDVMSSYGVFRGFISGNSSSTTYPVNNVHTIGANKYELGWLNDSEVLSIDSQTTSFSLAPLSWQPENVPETSYRLAYYHDGINEYSIEARRTTLEDKTDYDFNIPQSGVVVHKFDPMPIVYDADHDKDGNDPQGIYTDGEFIVISDLVLKVSLLSNGEYLLEKQPCSALSIPVFASKGQSADAITLRWLPLNYYSSFDIYRESESQAAEIIATITDFSAEEVIRGLPMTYLDKDIQPEQRYQYWIQGISACGVTALGDGVEGYASLFPKIPELSASSYYAEGLLTNYRNDISLSFVDNSGLFRTFGRGSMGQNGDGITYYNEADAVSNTALFQFGIDNGGNPLGNIKGVAKGHGNNGNNYVITDEGRVLAFGNNREYFNTFRRGLLGTGATDWFLLTPTLVVDADDKPLENVVKVVTTGFWSAAIHADGTVHEWGNTLSFNGLNHGFVSKAIELVDGSGEPVRHVKDIAVSREYTDYNLVGAVLILDNVGRVKVWGDSIWQFFKPDQAPEDFLHPAETGFSQLSANIRQIMLDDKGSHGMAVSYDGDLYIWGACNNYCGGNNQEQLAAEYIVSPINAETGEPLMNITKVVQVAQHYLALDSQGKAWVWGKRHNSGMPQAIEYWDNYRGPFADFDYIGTRYNNEISPGFKTVVGFELTTDGVAYFVSENYTQTGEANGAVSLPVEDGTQLFGESIPLRPIVALTSEIIDLGDNAFRVTVSSDNTAWSKFNFAVTNTLTHSQISDNTIEFTLNDGDKAGIEVIASDGLTSSQPILVVVDSTPNAAPIITMADTATVKEGDSITLEVSVTDADGETLTYEWTQLSGPTLTIGGADTINPTFTAPTVSANAVAVIQLAVSDGRETVTDSISLTIENQVTSTPSNPGTSGSSGGGGGAPGPLLLLLLFGITVRAFREKK